MAGGDLAGGKRTAADLGAWLVFEEESGQGLRPPKGRTWGRRGYTPVVRVTGGSNTRVSLAALIATQPGGGPFAAGHIQPDAGPADGGISELDHRFGQGLDERPLFLPVS